MFNSLLFLCGIIILSSCYDLPDTESIVMPVWEIEGIHIPLVNQTKSLEEIIEDDSTLTWFPEDGEQSPGVLYYSQSENIEGTVVGEHLKLDRTEVTISDKIGPVTINEITPIEAIIAISDWTPFFSGETVIIPPLTVPGLETEFEEIDAFLLAQFNFGKIIMTIVSNLPVEVTYSNFQIINNDGSGIVITKPIPSINIEANGSEVIEVEIEEGIEVINSLLLRIDISTDGSGGHIVTLPANAGTQLIAELVNNEISRVIASIPENVITIDSTFTMDSGGEPVELALAEISGGSFFLNMQSYFDIDATVELTFHDLYDNEGNNYNIVETIPKLGTLQVTEPDLSGWKIEPPELTDELRYTVTARTIPTASDDYREISEQDSFNVIIQFSELLVTKIDGRFRTEFQMEEQTFEIDYGDIYESFSFQEIKLEDSFIYLNLLTSTFLPVNINDGTISASNGIVTNTISIDQISLPSLEPVAIEVSDLFDGMTQLLPTHFTFNGIADMNPANDQIVIADTDSIFGNADIELPLKIKITGGSYTDLFELDISEETKDDIDNIQRINITFEIENRIPTGVSLVASVLDLQGNILLDIPTEYNEIDKIEVASPLMDNDGEVIEAGEITQSLELTGEDIVTFLEGDIIQLFFEFETAETTNEIVRFRITDTIRYNVWGEADYRTGN